MAHPYAGHRQGSVEHGRVKTLVKEYRAGGAVIPPLRPGAKDLPEPVRKALAAKGKVAGPGGMKPKGRADKAPRGGPVTDFEKSKMKRATGGRAILDDERGDAITDNAGEPVVVAPRRGTKTKGTNVNVIINGATGGQQPPQAIPVPMPMPPRPMPAPPPAMGGMPPGGPMPSPAPMGAGAGPMPMPAAGIPPGMPMIGRKRGGRVSKRDAGGRIDGLTDEEIAANNRRRPAREGDYVMPMVDRSGRRLADGDPDGPPVEARTPREWLRELTGRKKGGRVVQAPGNVGTDSNRKIRIGSLAPVPPEQGPKSGRIDAATGRNTGKSKRVAERRLGGKVMRSAADMDAGAGSGVGRLEEAAMYRRNRRASGIA